MDKFENEKIVYSDIVQNIGRFHLDREGYYTNDTAFIITGKDLPFLVGFLNSKAFSYLYKYFYSGGILGSSGVRYKKEFLLSVPLPDVGPLDHDFIETAVENIYLAGSSENKKYQYLAQIDQRVYQLYNLTPEEIAIVESSK